MQFGLLWTRIRFLLALSSHGSHGKSSEKNRAHQVYLKWCIVRLRYADQSPYKHSDRGRISAYNYCSPRLTQNDLPGIAMHSSLLLLKSLGEHKYKFHNLFRKERLYLAKIETVSG